MKLLSILIRTLILIGFLAFCTGIAIVLLTILMPENVLQAISIFKNIFSIS